MGAVKAAALERGIPLLQPANLAEFSGELRKREIELTLVVAYGKILPADVLAVPKFGSLNVHPSLLPRWRGPTPIQAAILAGDTVTGVTIIQMDAAMDHGPIVARREFPLGERLWTAPELSDVLADLGVELFLQTLDPWVRGEVTPEPQHHEAATYSRRLKKEDGHIECSQPACEIERMARAYKPWPGAYAFWRRSRDSVRLVVEEAGCRPLAAEVPPGTVMEHQGGLAVAAREGALHILRLKPEGGTSMAGSDFLRGHRDILGAVLV